MSSYHFELIIIPNKEHEFKYEILARQIFSQIEVLDIRPNFCDNNFYPATIKNDNGAVAMSKLFVRRKRKQQLPQFKKGRRS